MYNDEQYLRDERAGMQEGDAMPDDKTFDACWKVAPWVGPLAERIGRDVAYCMAECGMTRDEAVKISTLLPHFLTIVATKEPASMVKTMALNLYNEMVQGR